MSRTARKDDCIIGVTNGEHSGHTPPHSSCTLSGTIISGSKNVFINDKPAARIMDVTEEHDCCCAGSAGVIEEGSGKVFINGLNASRVGDRIKPHNGTAIISTDSSNGSPNVFIY